MQAIQGAENSSAGQVIVLAATCDPSRVDAALLRPGRFDVVLTMPSLTTEGKAELLIDLLARSPCAPDVSHEFLLSLVHHPQLHSATAATLKHLHQSAVQRALGRALGEKSVGAAVQEIQLERDDLLSCLK